MNVCACKCTIIIIIIIIFIIGSISIISTLGMQLIFILFYLLLNDRAGFTWRPQCLPYR